MGVRPRKTIVLTSRENFVWLSMQEIIPLIERNWLSSSARGSHEVLCRDVDRHSISELLPELLSADNVVFTCFTTKLCKIGMLLRESFGIEARYFIYLHNQATILCWPFHAWGMGKHLRQDDVFISTSTADAKTFKHSFKKSRVEVIPFTIPGIKPVYSVPPSATAQIPFVYAGRLSVQKNLHSLIYSFRLLRDSDPKLSWRLFIYGKDDNLGSPNMGMQSSGYGKFLREQTKSLGLEDRVVFAGYRNRSDLHRALASRRHIAVSASLHSDENFGMAQFHSLCKGNLAVLTRWGGYADFEKTFAGRVYLAGVKDTGQGPWVEPAEFARLLRLAARTYRRTDLKRFTVKIPTYYEEGRISSRLRELATEIVKPGPGLVMTPLAKKIMKKRTAYNRRAPDSSRIFKSYSDPDARVPFRTYGMSKSDRRLESHATGTLRCYPWIKLRSRSVSVRDPHRGNFELKLAPFSSRHASPITLTDWSGGVTQISQKTATKLLSLGYSHPLRTRGEP